MWERSCLVKLAAFSILILFGINIYIGRDGHFYRVGQRFIARMAPDASTKKVQAIFSTTEKMKETSNKTSVSTTEAMTSSSTVGPRPSTFKSVQNEGSFSESIEDFEDEEKSAFDMCTLYEHDAFEESFVEKFHNPKFNHTEGCKPAERYVEFVNGRVVLNKKGREKDFDDCEARCILFRRERTIRNQDFRNIDDAGEFECDIVEVVCDKGVYVDVLVQIYANRANPDLPPPKPKDKKFDIYILYMDSHSHTHAHRNLYKSLQYLKQNMSMVEFPFMNRVGENSYPNGVAFFLGYLIEGLERDMFNMSSVEPDYTKNELCDMEVADLSIFSNATAAGYKTMHAEDIVPNTLGYPNCKGFEKDVVTHNFQPLSLALRIDHYKYFKKTKTVKNCYMKYMDVMKYWKEFMHAYSDPKFAIIWFTELAHDDLSGSVAFDDELHHFLVNNTEKFDNSFFFILGDHGFRLSQAVMKSPLGSYELNNPMLALSVPKDLRSNKRLMKKLRHNARFLQTPFDVRATVLDILGPQAEANFQDHSEYSFPEEYGYSLLRNQPQPRNCKTLPIPPQYCLCLYRTVMLSTEDENAIAMGNTVIDSINQQLSDNNFTHLCGKWEFGKVLKLRQYEETGKYEVFMIRVAPSAPYKEAVFQTMLIRLGPNNHKVTSISRLDRYKSRGDCVKFDETICDCRRKEKSWYNKIWPF